MIDYAFLRRPLYCFWPMTTDQDVLQAASQDGNLVDRPLYFKKNSNICSTTVGKSMPQIYALDNTISYQYYLWCFKTYWYHHVYYIIRPIRIARFFDVLVYVLGDTCCFGWRGSLYKTYAASYILIDTSRNVSYYPSIFQNIFILAPVLRKNRIENSNTYCQVQKVLPVAIIPLLFF